MEFIQSLKQCVEVDCLTGQMKNETSRRKVYKRHRKNLATENWKFRTMSGCQSNENYYANKEFRTYNAEKEESKRDTRCDNSLNVVDRSHLRLH